MSMVYNDELSKLMKHSMYKHDDGNIIEFCKRTGMSYQKARRIKNKGCKRPEIDNMDHDVRLMDGELSISIKIKE